MVEVGGDTVVGEGAVTHDKIVRLLLSNGSDGFLGDIGVEAGNQEIVSHIEYLFACNLCLLDFAGKQNAQIQHDLEQEVFRGAVFLDVVFQHIEHIGVVLIRVVVHIFHVGCVALEYTEAHIQIHSAQRIFFLDFGTGTADTFFTDFADIFITHLIGFAILFCRFCQLY